MSELSWLPNHLLKDITLPIIRFEEHNEQMYAGYYRKEEELIVVVEYEYENNYIASIIAHEFMHHLQYIQGRKIDNTFLFGKLSFKQMSFEDQISKYFTINPNEYEALLFENKIAKTKLSEEWLRKLVWGN